MWSLQMPGMLRILLPADQSGDGGRHGVHRVVTTSPPRAGAAATHETDTSGWQAWTWTSCL